MEHDDVEIAFAALDCYGDGIAGAKERQIDGGVANGKVADSDLFEKVRQHGAGEDDLFLDGIDVETDGGLKQEK